MDGDHLNSDQETINILLKRLQQQVFVNKILLNVVRQ